MERLRNNTNVNRLLHTLVPFLIMVALQKGLILLFGVLGFGGTGAELCAFLPSAAAAFLLFRLHTYTPADDGDYDPVDPLRPRGFGVCVLLLLAALAALVGWMFAVAALMNDGGDSPLPSADALSLVSLLLLHPVVEEYLFRKMFYGELRLMNPIFGCLMQAVMFAIVHRTTSEMIFALGAGLVLGVLAERSGVIWCCAAAHILINLRSVLALTVFAASPTLRLRIDIVLIALGVVSLLALLIWKGYRGTASEPEET